MEVGSQPAIQNVTIEEVSVVVKRYSAECVCGRTFHHRDRRTLEHNLSAHMLRYHGSDSEYRQKLDYVQKQIRIIRNRLHGT